jgi:surfactin synthase thioesterase subunit
VTGLIAPAWFQTGEREAEATHRLFLFHCAGAGAAMYRDWQSLLPQDVGAVCVQLPGRQERIAEPAFTSMTALIDVLCEELLAELDDRPYAFFGHSMGALVAYRLAVAMSSTGGPQPALLGACAWSPEGFRTVPPETADLSEAEVLHWIRSLGSAPADVFDDPALLSLIIPAMRADLATFASCVDDGAVLECPVVSYSAAADPLLPNGMMSSWRHRTRAYLGNREFPGGHFFVYEQAGAIAADLVQQFRRHADRG